MTRPQLLVLAALLSLGCKGAPPVRSAVTIVSPREGDSTGASVLVRLEVDGARAVPADGNQREGEGHHHVFVDVDPTPADSIVPKREGIYHIGTGADTLRLQDLAPGPHRLIAVFAFGNHRPMPSVARDTVNFAVR